MPSNYSDCCQDYDTHSADSAAKTCRDVKKGHTYNDSYKDGLDLYDIHYCTTKKANHHEYNRAHAEESDDDSNMLEKSLASCIQIQGLLSHCWPTDNFGLLQSSGETRKKVAKEIYVNRAASLGGVAFLSPLGKIWPSMSIFSMIHAKDYKNNSHPIPKGSCSLLPHLAILHPNT
ncbi:hypothetical protein PROFUN_04012 [Planoprotostelium fungivorum]|uniref:Uncharacterized protein n=1 Tax=Planoprotostelium fungivorum TaxID=1890364 RepID=A0A2P6NW58_9EUKA|nr:hypothetical protein PROFUN_04012 [Planoprotostelium fungivorum]